MQSTPVYSPLDNGLFWSWTGLGQPSCYFCGKRSATISQETANHTHAASYSTAAVDRSGGGGRCSRVLSTLDSFSRETLKTGCQRQWVGISRTKAFSPAAFRMVNGPAYGCWNFRELILLLAVL